MFSCEPCLATFSRTATKANHEKTEAHKNRVEALKEAKKIWEKIHPGVRMPIRPEEEMTLEKAKEIYGSDYKEIIPLGKVGKGIPGTIPCVEPRCKGVTHIHLGGQKRHKIFEVGAYKILTRATDKTKIALYVQSCISHPLYRYVGVFDQSIGLGHYITDKNFTIRSLRALLKAEFGDYDPTEDEDKLVKFILKLLQANKIRANDSFLHFCRPDCHPLYMRIDVVATYESTKDYNSYSTKIDGKMVSAEAHLQSASGACEYWTGGHNQRDETSGRKNTDLRAPIAFSMLAPMDNLAHLKEWMDERGLVPNHHYKTTDRCTPIVYPSPAKPDSSSTIWDDELRREEQIHWLMAEPMKLTREQAETEIDGLWHIAEKYISKEN